MGYTHETSFPASIGFGKASREMDNLEFTFWLQVVDSCKVVCPVLPAID